MHNENQSAVGPVAGLVIIVIVMIVGAVYFVQTTKQTITERAQTADEIRNSIDPQTESLRSVGSSDEIESIADDANLTDLTDLLPEIGSIESTI